MPEGQLTLGDLASQVRSKNAGPFWITLDVFFASRPDYQLVTRSAALSEEVIGRLYRVDPATVKYFELPAVLALKISFPRPVTAGSFEDRDLHAGQQYVPLLGVRLPAGKPADPAGRSGRGEDTSRGNDRLGFAASQEAGRFPLDPARHAGPAGVPGQPGPDGPLRD